MKIRILSIMEWTEDSHLMDGDASHEGWRPVQRMLEEERRKKIDDEWQPDELPMVVEADDEADAIDIVNETLFEYDYLKASEIESEEVEG